MSHTQIGRADLLRMILAGYTRPEDLLPMAFAAGYQIQKQAFQLRHNDEPQEDEDESPPSRDQLDVEQAWPNNAAEPKFWLAAQFRTKRNEQIKKLQEERNKPAEVRWSHAPEDPPEHKPLSPWNVLEPRLRSGVRRECVGRRVDLQKIIQRLSQGRMLTELPRRRARLADNQIVVISDRSNRLIPYWHDQDLVFENLARQLPSHGIRDCVGSHPDHLCYVDGGTSGNFDAQQHPQCAVVLGDMGVLETHSNQRFIAWLSWARRLSANGVQIVALVPSATQQIPQSLRTIITTISWQKNRTAWIHDRHQRQNAVHSILKLLAPVIRLEPGLLRDVREMVSADASLESDLWQHWSIRSQNYDAATPDDNYSKQLMADYSESNLAKRVVDRIRHWRHRFCGLPFVWFEEITRMRPETRKQLIPQSEIDEAFSALRTLQQSQEKKSENDAYIQRFANRLPAHVKKDPEIGSLVTALCAAAEGSGGVVDPVNFYFSQSGGSFECGSLVSGSPIGSISGSTSEVKIWKSPHWLSDCGRDSIGNWAEFRVGEVTQRMRWIPAGTFLMGSPEDEEGRDDDEGPQHEVKITRGFWMFDTSVTQQLWQAVMDNNPAEFKEPLRPVENVSWDDAQEFLEKLNQHFAEKLFVLPSEAQWEYACRARTKTRYSCGDEITEQLAKFNLPDGTAQVGNYEANQFGLFDMHGNVWEWCQDWFDSAYYASSERDDPRGPDSGHSRVLRGGSWGNGAQFVRSAYRRDWAPGDRGNDIGFRCAQVQGVAEPTEEDGREAEPDAVLTIGGEASAKFQKGKPQRIALPSAAVVVVKTDLDSLELRRIPKPDWASAIGRDRYGLWADLTVADSASTVSNSQSGVTQRMRWIPPGRFQMGSASGDEMTIDHEQPQHEVILTHGYWLFDTSVTQELWNAVMPKNPSSFDGKLRPVDSVSRDDSQEFMKQLHEKVEGLSLCLPTEAEWEFACRAGTTTRYNFGDQVTSADARFDVTSEEGTAEVKSYAPNSWGIFDMHGNVYEWCEDWYGGYIEESQVNPCGPSDGRNRVLRGGSWNDLAQSVRSAYRDHWTPDFRNYSIGFRCAQVHQSSRNSERTSGVQE